MPSCFGNTDRPVCRSAERHAACCGRSGPRRVSITATAASAAADAANAAKLKAKKTVLNKLVGEQKDSELKLSDRGSQAQKSYQQKLYQGTVTNAQRAGEYRKRN